MSSILKVDTIQDQDGNNIINENANVITIGASGDSITSVGTFTSFSSTGIDDNATSTAITIDSSENVGIGTASPTAKIHGLVSPSWDTTNYAFLFQNQETQNSYGNTVRIIGGGGAGAGNSASNILTVGDNDDNIDFVVRGDGNVGIGTSSPSSKLDVVGSVRVDTGSSYQFGSSNYKIEGSSVTNPRIGFITNATERMRIDSSGNVGIRTSSPQEHLSINVALNDTEGLGLQYSNDTKGGIKLNPIGGEVRMGAFNSTGTYFTTFYSNNVEAMRIDSFGRFVINGDTPDTGAIQTTIHDGNTTYGLTLATVNTSGTQYHQRFLRGGGGGTSAGYITSNSATTIAFNNASDERLKENIENSGSAIQDLKDIQVRQFDWIDNIDTHRDFGFVAQELVNVVPEAVTQGTDELDENGKPVISWGVDYSHIVPRLVKVCQEQQTKIEDLEARILALETNQP